MTAMTMRMGPLGPVVSLEEPRSHVTVVEAPDGSMQEARLPPPEQTSAPAESREQQLKRLYRTIDEFQHASNIAIAGAHEAQAQIERLYGQEAAATWYEAMARRYRDDTPENRDAADSAWAAYQNDKAKAAERLKATKG